MHQKTTVQIITFTKASLFMYKHLFPCLCIQICILGAEKRSMRFDLDAGWISGLGPFNPLTPELNPSAQRSLTRLFYWGFCFLNHAFR
jgi:hypothetical protein